jgi:hypothetical protein
VPYLGPDADDDPSKSEQSHYVKFVNLQAQYADYAGCKEVLPPEPPPPDPQLPAITDAELADAGLVLGMPDNPTSAGYPADFRPIADFCSACFQYMLIMTETIYRVPPNEQKLFFNEGLHRSMIWVLDKYIRTIREIPLPGGGVMGPLFENVDLGAPRDSFAGLTRFGNEAIDAANAIAAAQPALADTMGDVVYYVGVALTKTGTDGAPMHLPDVGPYWADA